MADDAGVDLPGVLQGFAQAHLPDDFRTHMEPEAPGADASAEESAGPRPTFTYIAPSHQLKGVLLRDWLHGRFDKKALHLVRHLKHRMDLRVPRQHAASLLPEPSTGDIAAFCLSPIVDQVRRLGAKNVRALTNRFSAGVCAHAGGSHGEAAL